MKICGVATKIVDEHGVNISSYLVALRSTIYRFANAHGLGLERKEVSIEIAMAEEIIHEKYGVDYDVLEDIENYWMMEASK